MLDYRLSPVEYLWDGSDLKEKSRVQTFLGSLKFTAEEMEHRIADLSEGQKCKILLAKLILDHNDVLLLDEPTRNLSPLSGPRIRQILAEYGGCIIAVTHDRKFIEEVTDKVCSLENGVLRFIEQ